MAQIYPDTKRINLRLPDRKLEDLKKEAKKLGISVNALIITILAEKDKKGGE